MSAVVDGLALEHPAWCDGGPCESKRYPDGTREEVHMRDLPEIPGTDGCRVWLSAIWGTAPDGALSYRKDAVGVDGRTDSITSEQAEQLARDLVEAARLVRAAAAAGAR